MNFCKNDYFKYLFNCYYQIINIFLILINTSNETNAVPERFLVEPSLLVAMQTGRLLGRRLVEPLQVLRGPRPETPGMSLGRGLVSGLERGSVAMEICLKSGN